GARRQHDARSDRTPAAARAGRGASRGGRSRRRGAAPGLSKRRDRGTAHAPPSGRRILTRMTRLSVNLNKIALLRNSRGGSEPDVLRAARTCLDAGAHGLTLHPRPDARHARADDVMALAALASG